MRRKQQNPDHYRFRVPPTDAVQIEEHVQVTAELPKAVHRRAEWSDGAFWEIGNRYVFKERADEETQPDVFLCQLIGLGQGDYLLLYLRGNMEEMLQTIPTV